MDTIAYIPARDSSKRLPNKNIATFNSKSLVENTLLQAHDSGVFDRIILSSNSEKILNIGKRVDAQTHLRLDVHDTIIEVLRQDIEDLGLHDSDILCILLVTCPLRESKDIVNALNMFKNQPGPDFCHRLVSVRKNENPIQMSFTMEGKNLYPFMPEAMEKSTRKQDHSPTYFFNDAIIIDTVKSFKRTDRNLYGDYPLAYEMPWDRSIAIDYEFQLKIAQLLGEEKLKWQNLRG